MRLESLPQEGPLFRGQTTYRSPEHNRTMGGAPASKHMQGTAFDIAMSNHDPAAFEAAARAVGFLGFGTYPRSGFMHIDLGPARSWGDPFPARLVPFGPELPPVREVLSESRTLRGGGAAGMEVLQDALVETQSTIGPGPPARSKRYRKWPSSCGCSAITPCCGIRPGLAGND
ncbi:YcbK family protein [Cereibacter sphaeroides]|uniref:YcbK family protein n=1 Tax=Cereibacter sphaeroides TaxID=1063 RepID=UPI0024550F0F|nr:D-Ala-D-Ala carboxypeptidase family metallohydrolase [Cereibacter sphaeroides]